MPDWDAVREGLMRKFSNGWSARVECQRLRRRVERLEAELRQIKAAIGGVALVESPAKPPIAATPAEAREPVWTSDDIKAPGPAILTLVPSAANAISDDPPTFNVVSADASARPTS